MQTVSEIRHHIHAVTQTRKITSAMETVSSARMKKFSVHIPYNNTYYQRLQSVMKDILASSQDVNHPYLLRHRGHRHTYIVIAGDKEMAGSYNANILRMAYEEIRKDPDCNVVTVGIIATRFFKKRGIEPIFDVQGIAQNPTLYNASQLALPVMELFDKDETDEIYVFYTLYAGPDGRPVNAPHKARLLPIRLRDYERSRQRKNCGM